MTLPLSTKSRGAGNGLDVGSGLVIAAGIALIIYGIVFLFRNFNGFIELGLTPAHIGATPDQIRSFSPRLFNYISHLQVAIAGFIMALGIAVISLAWYGMRQGMSWAASTVLLVVITAVTVTLPLHYVYGLATLGHLGSLYVDVAALIVGALLSLRTKTDDRARLVARPR
jgi:sterol desaturase/sphingolipid hydroxylase (fatty acid hydroxylase superfamily)